MKAHLSIVSTCLGLLCASNACFGVKLYVDNRTNTPFTMTVLKDNGNTQEVRLGANGYMQIGYLGDTRKDNVDRIVDLNFVEGWKAWSSRLAKWKSLPRVTDTDMLNLDGVMTILKERAEKVSSKFEFVLKIELDAQNKLTFAFDVVGDWVVVPR